jgi:hypothetical protein
MRGSPACETAVVRFGVWRAAVAIDLGSFLLLRFLPEGRSGPGAVRWIPVGRRGLEREWHAFRCAVYSPRPAAGSTPADPRLP